MRNYFLIASLCFCAISLLTFFSGCVRQNAPTSGTDAAPSKDKVFISGTLKLPATAQSQPSLFLEIHDAEGTPIPLASRLKQKLSSHFALVTSPSEASCILHVAIPFEGSCDAASLQKMTDAGFGSATPKSGAGGCGILADILLVTRQVPDTGKLHTTHLKNISARNALDNAQVRIGVHVPGEDLQKARAILEKTLLDELGNTFDNRSARVPPIQKS